MSESINHQNTDCISVEQLKQLISKHQAVSIIDVRTKEEFDLLHIPGATHIPGDILSKAATDFNTEQLYITVCGKGGGRSSDAAEVLCKLNLKAMALCGGTFAWFSGSEPNLT